MKTIISFITCIMLSVGMLSQITATEIGLPESIVTAMDSVVYTSQFEQCSGRAPGYGGMELVRMTVTRNGVKVLNKIVITETKYYKPGIRENVGVYGLNLVRYDMNDFGYSAITQNDSGFVLTSTSGNRSVYWRKGGKWYNQKYGPDYGMQLKDPITKVSRRYSESELIQNFTYVKRGTSKEIPITSEMLKKWNENYRIGEARDPKKYVCNIFSRIVNVSPGVFKAEIFVNRINIDNINEQNLITSFGKSGMTFTPRWKFLNQCTKGDANDHFVPLNEYGNAGTCDAIQGNMTTDFSTISVIPDVEPYYDRQAGDGVGDTFYYDPTKKCWLWFQVESFQAQGKNEGADAFYDVGNNVIRHNLFNN